MAGALLDPAFVLLAVLSEGPRHGYELQRIVHDRGFRFWTRIRRSTTYNSLHQLDESGLVSARSEPGDGPSRRVYEITEEGRDHLRGETVRRLAEPNHPRSELDLGIYALPTLPRGEALDVLRRCREFLLLRREFLAERLAWCRTRNLTLPALAFERPLVALDAELAWLDRLLDTIERDPYIALGGWEQYVYREPPSQ